MERHRRGGICINTGCTPSKKLPASWNDYEMVAAALLDGEERTVEGRTMSTGITAQQLAAAPAIHPTISELVPTLLQQLRPPSSEPSPPKRAAAAPASSADFLRQMIGRDI